MFALTGIGSLVTNDPERDSGLLGIINDAALVADDSGVVTWVGPSRDVASHTDVAPHDAGGRAVIPGFVDSHTHLVFSGDRAAEFEARMAGRPYSAVRISRAWSTENAPRSQNTSIHLACGAHASSITPVTSAT